MKKATAEWLKSAEMDNEKLYNSNDNVPSFSWHAQSLKESGHLKAFYEPEAIDLVGKQIADVFTSEMNTSLIRLVKAKNCIEQRGFPAPIRSNKPPNAATAYVQVHPVDSIKTPKMFANFSQFEQRFLHVQFYPLPLF